MKIEANIELDILFIDALRKASLIGNQYSEIITSFSERKFVTFLNNEIEKSYLDFHLDVTQCISKIHAQAKNLTHVATVSENSYDLLVVQMSTLLLRKTLVPLNPNEGIDRLDQKLSIFRDDIIVYDPENKFDKYIKIDFTSPDQVIDLAYIFNRDCENDAVKVFTSGSTGEQKIVRLSEKNILSNIFSLRTHHNLRNDLVIGTCLPLFHVNALFFSFLATFMCGAQVIFFSTLDIVNISNFIDKYKINILSLYPSLLTLISEIGFDMKKLGSLKYIISAAAPLAPSTIEYFFKHYNILIVQGYGLSELVNFSTSMPIDLDRDFYEKYYFKYKHPSVGVALSCNTVQILRQDLEKCNEGEEGEIVISGSNLMFGYQNNNPIESSFFTGDLGYYFFDQELKQNFYFVSGRKKEVIKRFGETISLREVDEEILKEKIEGIDFISVGFKNKYSGEEVGIVVKTSENSPELFLQFCETIKKLNEKFLKPKVIVLTSKQIRSPSGKALRWIFQQYFNEFEDQRLVSMKVKNCV